MRWIHISTDINTYDGYIYIYIEIYRYQYMWWIHTYMLVSTDIHICDGYIDQQISKHKMNTYIYWYLQISLHVMDTQTCIDIYRYPYMWWIHRHILISTDINMWYQLISTDINMWYQDIQISICLYMCIICASFVYILISTDIHTNDAHITWIQKDRLCVQDTDMRWRWLVASIKL